MRKNTDFVFRMTRILLLKKMTKIVEEQRRLGKVRLHILFSLLAMHIAFNTHALGLKAEAAK